MRRVVLAGLALAGLLLAGGGRAEVPVPPLTARVTDLTGTLSSAQKSELESRLAAFEARRGSQIAVLILPTTRPEEIEQFSIRVAEVWKIGRKGVDDGVILIVAKDDRRVRIEVGYGLEGAIPDSLADRVIEEQILPRFRRGEFYAGILDGVEQLMRLAEGEKLPPPRRASGGRRGTAGQDPSAWIVPALIFAAVAGAVLKALLGRVPGSLATGAALGALAWLVFGLAVAAIAAVVGFILAFANTGRGGWSSGWSGGGWGGGSWGGGASSSSWGGGGGGFGGGGSSGRW